MGQRQEGQRTLAGGRTWEASPANASASLSCGGFDALSFLRGAFTRKELTSSSATRATTVATPAAAVTFSSWSCER